jgi:hypothetical protein
LRRPGHHDTGLSPPHRRSARGHTSSSRFTSLPRCLGRSGRRRRHGWGRPSFCFWSGFGSPPFFRSGFYFAVWGNQVAANIFCISCASDSDSMFISNKG